MLTQGVIPLYQILKIRSPLVEGSQVADFPWKRELPDIQPETGNVSRKLREIQKFLRGGGRGSLPNCVTSQRNGTYPDSDSLKAVGLPAAV